MGEGMSAADMLGLRQSGEVAVGEVAMARGAALVKMLLRVAGVMRETVEWNAGDGGG
jgi:hypothetical protein